jgi:BirA family transcriptional regulator, biotin operon repressor / biotin---[acetyl-CoA-carboxylase] ligase
MANKQKGLLELFLQSQEEGHIVKKSALASTLGLSSLEQEEALAQLETEGFEFCTDAESYRCTAFPKSLHQDLVASYLELAGMDLPSLVILKTIDSTNTEVARLLNEGAAWPVVVASSQQTAGRGRRGRAWNSASTSNLYLSVGFKCAWPNQKLQLFTLWLGLRLCDYLRQATQLPLQMKWPNDIMCAHKKIAGMLTEASIKGDYTQQLVFGLGLNINSKIEEIPEALREKASSLYQLSGKEWNIHGLTAACIRVVIEAYDQFVAGNYLSSLEALWDSYDALKNNIVRVEQLNQVIIGRAAGINAQGALRIKLENGQYYALSAGDVSLSHFYEAAHIGA